MADAWSSVEPGGEPVDGERIKRELALYIGPNADRYLKAFELTGKGGIAYRTSWHWPAALALIPWLFYRKLYLFGALLSLAIIGSIALFPDLPNALYTSVHLAFALAVKSLYLAVGLKSIEKADERGHEGAEREAYLEKAGGTSVPGAVMGSAGLVAGVLALVYVALQPAELPGCDDPAVRALAADLSAQIATEAGLPDHTMSVHEFKELRASDPDTTRRCQMTARAGERSARVVFTILWEDEDTGEFRMLMGRLKIKSLFE